jgi:primosomal protein N' (replication factor Y) (superfamily II helicase)
MPSNTRYADLLLPLPIKGCFTYAVPEELQESLQTGVRVVVQFGRKKLYTALVRKIHSKNPGIHVKPILVQMDIRPVVNHLQFAFWEWMAGYYMCSMGEVMNAALPPALKLSSESRIALNPDFDKDYSKFTDREYLVIAVLEQRKEISIAETAKIAGQLRVIPLINALIEKSAVQVYEEVLQRYKPKTEKFYLLADTYRSNDLDLNAILSYLENRAPKQNEVLQALLHFLELHNFPEQGISRTSLLEELPKSDAALRSLVEKEIVSERILNVSRLQNHEAASSAANIQLTSHQAEAFHQIKKHFIGHSPVLLHGITSSGKTEIYIKLIDDALRNGKQVLYLLPEIALTTQIINRLRMYFGDVVGVYHSRYGEAERAEVWNRVASWQAPPAQNQKSDDNRGEINQQNKLTNGPNSQDFASHSVILGARSALLLPFSALGLLIVDEEHDSSYKQYDPNPRYHARDAAVYLAHQHQSNILLGTATPALESYFNAKTGRYAMVGLTKRYGDLLLPAVEIANVKEATRLKQMKSHFSPLLLKAIEEALAREEQIILFQNRRGFSLRIECTTCHHIPECRHCDVTLIYHKREKHLRCHYCGYSEPVPPRCPKCENPDMNLIGFGTEKVEEELALLYPEIRISRMDFDTTRSKHAHFRIIRDFEEKRIEVLTGTQMVTKGLDFDNVSLVGILNADSMISFPDFRSFERSYQLMAQVSGRAGRKNKQGKVIIQTRNPQHPVIRFVIDNNYEGMYKYQISERHKFNYPPYSRLIKLSLRHKDPEPLSIAAAGLARMLRKEFPKQILGPEFPVVGRIRNYYIKEILVKLRRDATLPQAKAKISDMIEMFLKTTSHKQVRVAIDVDPL